MVTQPISRIGQHPERFIVHQADRRELARWRQALLVDAIFQLRELDRAAGPAASGREADAICPAERYCSVSAVLPLFSDRIPHSRSMPPANDSRRR